MSQIFSRSRKVSFRSLLNFSCYYNVIILSFQLCERSIKEFPFFYRAEVSKTYAPSRPPGILFPFFSIKFLARYCSTGVNPTHAMSEDCRNENFSPHIT